MDCLTRTFLFVPTQLQLQFQKKKKLSNLKYLEACLLEALRLHPSVPVDVKYAVDRDILPDGTVIEAGWGINYSPYIIGRSTEVWGANAESYDPERWFQGNKPNQFMVWFVCFVCFVCFCECMCAFF